jgi:uncharacterized membrane protein
VSREDREAAERVHVVAQRAVKRLDLLEWVFWAGGGVITGLGGAAIAWMLAPLVGWDFRSAWVGASLFLFVVAGTIAIVQIRKDERASALQVAEKRNRIDG